MTSYTIERDTHVKWEGTDRETFGTISNRWAVRDADTNDLVECCVTSMKEARSICQDGNILEIDRTEWVE